MIALLLAAQLSAIQTPTTDVRLPPNYIAGSRPTPQDIISQLKPTTPCGAAGRAWARRSWTMSARSPTGRCR